MTAPEYGAAALAALCVLGALCWLSDRMNL